MKAMLYALINRSTLVTNDEAMHIAKAVDRQLVRDIGPAWGRTAPRMRFYPDPRKVPNEPGVAVFDLQDVDDNVPDALGYHDEANDRFYAPILCKPIFDEGGDALTVASGCVSSVTSHEAAELFGDGPVNIWADMPDGRSTAYELADGVQDGSYAQIVGGKTVMVSNFLLPAWFDRQNTTGPFDHLGQLKEPFTRTPGGYMIVRTVGRETQVFGELPAHKRGRQSRRHGRRGVGSSS